MFVLDQLTRWGARGRSLNCRLSKSLSFPVSSTDRLRINNVMTHSLKYITYNNTYLARVGISGLLVNRDDEVGYKG